LDTGRIEVIGWVEAVISGGCSGTLTPNLFENASSQQWFFPLPLSQQVFEPYYKQGRNHALRPCCSLTSKGHNILPSLYFSAHAISYMWSLTEFSAATVADSTSG
jgi:hypothetical protein